MKITSNTHRTGFIMIEKLEKKFGKYAIPNLTLALIIGYALGYLIKLFDNFRGTDFISFLYLDPWKIIHGQVWRVITWLIVPPTESNIIFVLLMMWCCLSIGMVLEKTWGTFRFNLYIFGGILFTVISAFAALGFVYITSSADGWELFKSCEETGFKLFVANNVLDISNPWPAFSTYYINVSIYLGFAMTYPNNTVRFMFFIPMKMFILGIIDLVYMVYLLIFGGVFTRFAVVAALLNILIFYLVNLKRFSIRNKIRKDRFNRAYREGQRRAQQGRSGQWQNTADYRRTEMSGASANTKIKPQSAARHKCSICGQTEISNPSLEFRYCSKCRGNYEYCQEHLFTHTHKT